MVIYGHRLHMTIYVHLQKVPAKLLCLTNIYTYQQDALHSVER